MERHVQFLDLPADLTQTLDPAVTPSNLLPITASLDGTVVMINAVAGESVDPTHVLFAVANLDPLWLMLDVHFEDVQYLHNGQAVHFRPDGAQDQTHRKKSRISQKPMNGRERSKFVCRWTTPIRDFPGSSRLWLRPRRVAPRE